MRATHTTKSYHEIACEVGAALTSGLALEEALEGVARRMAEALGVWECDVYDYYPDSETIVATTVWAREMTEADRDWIGTVWSLRDHASSRRVLVDGVLEETYADKEGAEAIDRELMEQWGELATMSVPLPFQGRVIGCFTLIEKRFVRHFTDEDKELARLLAVPAAIAVHHSRLFRRQEQQECQLASLVDSSRVLTSAVVLEDMLTVVCREAAAALSTAEAVIYEYDAEREEFVFRAIHQDVPTPSAEAQVGVEYDVDARPGDREMLSSGAIVEDHASDPELDPYVRDSMREWGEKTCLNVPLLFEGTPVGELVLIESAHERHFSPEERGLAKALGEQAAVAIVNARLYRAQQERNSRLLALLETSRALAASLDADAVLRDTAAAIGELFALPADAVGITLRGDPAFEVVARDDLSRAALESGAPARSPTESGVRLVAPLGVAGDVQGLVDLTVRGRSSVPDEDLGMVQILAAEANGALTNARLYRTVREQAITDGLTGLYNHRYFYDRLGQEFARAQRYGIPLSLLMVDIDDFKEFNDTYGHSAGDLVLERVAHILMGDLRRDVDVAARYGGEEFAVILPDAPRDGAQKVGDRIAHEVAALAGLEGVPEHPGGARMVGERIRRAVETTAVSGTHDRSVTVSVGVAAHPSAGDPDELVREADKALYLAKRLGKNRVEVFVG